MSIAEIHVSAWQHAYLGIIPDVVLDDLFIKVAPSPSLSP
jgi:hypothetical protein